MQENQSVNSASKPEVEPENAIEVKSLLKKFGSKCAVNYLTFNVPTGSITGFIGPNGAGKTTTLRILSTLLSPDSGSVKIFNQSVRTSSTYIRHKMGFMPDHFGLYEDMEVTEYLDFFAAAYHIPHYKRQQLISDILALLDLTVKRNALVNELSRGMQQRLSLGRCLVHDPKLLLLDEPASGLDPRARIELMALLRELRRMGKTIFISSHILSELKELCDFVVIIERGKMIYNGTVADAANTISGESGRMRIILDSRAGEAEKAILAWEDAQENIKVESEGETVIIVEYLSDVVSASQIIKFLVTNNFSVEEAFRETANLEDVFMTLTEGGVA